MSAEQLTTLFSSGENLILVTGNSWACKMESKD
jgi:hypothetical protein